ncbi:MAG: ATP-binding protein, partial [Pseudomonadota bacterium]
CRNMLIYLETPAQKRAFTNLHFGLKDDGCLFIGPSESLGDMAPFFETRSETIKAFTKSGHGRGRLLLSEGLTSIGNRLNQPSQRATHAERRPQGDSLMLRALEHVAETLGDPGVLIGADNHLIYSFGDLTDLITLPKGGFTSDISRLVKSELRVPLAAALRRCATNRKSVSYNDIIIRSGTEDVMLSLQIDPLPSTQKDDLNFIVLFKRQNLATPKLDVESGQPAVMAHTANEEALEVLEAELKSTKETLQATIEELETSNEELQSSNEELIASNEELQSTNEELHSVNEELQTVNTEYQAKINELNEVSEDFENLLKSTNIGTIFLDKNLRIRRFTKSVSDVIDLIDHDIGRRIDQFRTSFGDIGFIDIIKRVSQTGKPHIQEIQLVNGLAFMMRVLPFQSATGTDSGVVITFIDVTSLERAGAALARAETELQEVFSAFPAPAATVDSSGMILKTNPAWLNIFGYTAEANNGRHINSFFNLTTNDPSAQSHEEIWETLKDNSDLNDWRVFGLKNSGARFPAGIHFTEGDPAIIVLEDLSDKEKQNLALKDAINELRRSNIELEQFGSVVAHDLKEPLRAVRGFAKLVRDDIGETETEGVGEHLDRIDSGVARMQAMIDDLLNFATITSDDSHRVEVDFDKIVGEVKKILKTKIEQTGTHITVGELPTLRARPGQMIHVLQNLIDNAIKYRSDNPPDIKIEAERLNGRWKFCVSDNGIGLKEQHREKIFEIFKRLHGRGKYAGTGIGLAIVKKIVNNHGGSIWVESEIGVGSRFFFTIEGDD